MIMTGMALAGAAAALGSAIYGGIKSSQANNKARKLIQQERDENKRWYDTRMSQDYTMRTDVQAAIKKQREMLNEQYTRARATNAVAGGSDASLALQQEAANKSLSDTMTDVAAQSSAYKDSIEQQYRAHDAALNQQQAASYQQQAAQTAQAASQGVNAGLNLMGNSIAMNATPKVTPSAGKSPLNPGAIAAQSGAVSAQNAQNALNDTIRNNVLQNLPPSQRKANN